MATRGKSHQLTENKLVHGWTSSPRVHIRQATASDIDTMAVVATLADVPFEGPLRQAITDGTAGVGLRVGLRSGHEAYMRYMAGRFTALQHDNPMKAYLEAALVLVADHRDNGVVGGLIAYPPVNVAQRVIDGMQRVGFPEERQYQAILGTGVFLTRIKALGVLEHARGTNIGGSLLKWCKLVYFHCGYETIYGSMPSTPGLEQFYRRAGFLVQDYGQPLDLSVMFGMSTHISPDRTQRIFRRDRPKDD